MTPAHAVAEAASSRGTVARDLLDLGPMVTIAAPSPVTVVADLTPAPAGGAPQIFAIAFDSPLRAQEALLAALRLEERGLLTLHDAVFINRAPSGHTEIIETSDPSAVAAAVPTSLLGALIGTLLAGPIGLIVGGVLAGGGGALAAKLIDTGIPDRVVEELGALTQPGQTSLVLLVSDVVGRAALAELRRFRGARIVYADVPPAALEVMRQVVSDVM
jgi:uncharacterized membrane protein